MIVDFTDARLAVVPLKPFVYKASGRRGASVLSLYVKAEPTVEGTDRVEVRRVLDEERHRRLARLLCSPRVEVALGDEVAEVTGNEEPAA